MIYFYWGRIANGADISSLFLLAICGSFPGTLTDGCLSSTNDPEVSKAAMHYCDASMSLLIGSKTSLGTLHAIVDDVEANGLDYMPGECCFDSPTQPMMNTLVSR